MDGKPRTTYLLGRLDRVVRRALDEILADSDISVPGYTALTILASNPGLSNAQLAKRSLTTPQGMNQALAGLIDNGLIERTPDERNRRIQRLELTERGHQVVADYDRRIAIYEEELLACLSEEQRGDLNGTLLAIVNANRR